MASANDSYNEDNQDKDMNFIPRDRNGLYGLHISNFNNDITEQDLRKLFQTVGRVHVCKIVNFKGTAGNTQNRVAFVKYKTYSEALAGLQRLNGAEILRSYIVVKPALVQNATERHNTPRNSRASPRKSPSPAVNPENYSETSDINEHNDLKSPSGGGEIKWSNGHNGPPASLSVASPITAQEYYVVPAESMCKDVREINFQTRCMPQSSPTPESSGHLNWSNTNGPSFWPGDVRCNETNSYDSHVLSPSNQGTLTPPHDQKKPMAPGSLSEEDEALASVTATIKQLEMSRSSSASLLSNNDITKQLEMPQPSSTFLGAGNSNVRKWTVSDVLDYLENIEQCSDTILAFVREEEINGKALLLLDRECLMPYMKLGPLLNLLQVVEKLKNCWLAQNTNLKSGNVVW